MAGKIHGFETRAGPARAPYPIVQGGQLGARFLMSLNSRPVSDVIFAFFGVSYTASLARAKIMPEDRFVDARGERLIVADPYRNYAGVLRDRLKGVREPPFPATTRRSLYSPRRLRRTTPANPARTVARYERGLRNLRSEE